MNTWITRRRSVRKYTATPVDDATLENILAFAAKMNPLYPDIRVSARVVKQDQVRFYLPWKTPQLLAIYSETTPGYLENVGFLFQQMDLYLQSLGLGSCWMGLGKLRQDPVEDLEFVILLAFGWPDEVPPRTHISQFHRRSPSEIADREDAKLEPARLAPSSTNSQPWYFTHEGDKYHAFQATAGLLKHKMLGKMNRIDMGIALAQLYVANTETFRFSLGDVTDLKGYDYIGSFTL